MIFAAIIDAVTGASNHAISLLASSAFELITNRNRSANNSWHTKRTGMQVHLECNIGAGCSTGVNFALERWLPHLGALPHCHTITLSGGAVTGPAAVQGGLGAAAALQELRGDVINAHALIEARATRGLPAITFPAHELPDTRRNRASRWMLPAPNVRYGRCTILPEPQLDPTSCTAVRYNDFQNIR